MNDKVNSKKKTCNQDSIKYTGKVSVKVISDNKAIRKFQLKNKGEEALFLGVCRYLLKEADENQYVPANIDLISDNNSILSSPSKITTSGGPVIEQASGDDNYYYTYYNSIISFSQLKSIPDSWDGLKLCLLSDSGDLLASVDYPESAEFGSPGLSVIIQWRLYIYDGGVASPEI